MLTVPDTHLLVFCYEVCTFRKYDVRDFSCGDTMLLGSFMFCHVIGVPSKSSCSRVSCRVTMEAVPT